MYEAVTFRLAFLLSSVQKAHKKTVLHFLFLCCTFQLPLTFIQSETLLQRGTTEWKGFPKNPH